MPNFVGTAANRRPTSSNHAVSWLIGKCSPDDDVPAPGVDGPRSVNRPVGENNEDGSVDDRSLSCSLVALAGRILVNGHTGSVSVASMFVRHPRVLVGRLAICVCSVAVYVSTFRIGEAGRNNYHGFIDNCFVSGPN